MSVSAYLEREKRADLRAGVVAATLVNVNLKRGARQRRPADFFPSLQRDRKRPRGAQTPARQLVMLKAITLAAGGRIVRRDEADGD